MFNLEKYCLSKAPPTDEYILVCRYINYIHRRTVKDDSILIPNLDSNGALVVINPDGEVLYTLPSIYDNYRGLVDFFHQAMLYEDCFKFYIDNSNLHINIYLYKPLFTDPKYMPFTFEIQTPPLPKLQATLAMIEQIDNSHDDLFQVDMYNYQQNNVAWMIGIEELTNAKCNFLQYPQLREQNLVRTVYGDNTLFYNRLSRFLYPSSYEDVILHHNHQLKGGLLCDEVGLGKTFSMYGLIVNTLDRDIGFWDRKPTKKMLAAESEDWEEIAGPLDDNEKPIRKFKSNATLIICPTRLCGQWADELDKFMIPLHDLRVYNITTITLYRKLTAADLCNADIVIVSDRFFINNNYKRHIMDPGNFGLDDFYWKRLIIDEGHEIMVSNYYTNSIEIRDAVYKFKSQYCWLCTGTPFPHEYDSLDHYLHFLTGSKYKFDDYKSFDADLVNTFLQQNTRKNTYDNIKAQIFIPPIEQTTILLTQDPIERAMYVNATGQPLRMIQLCTNILVSGVDSSIIDDNATSLEDVRQRMITHYQREIDAICRQQVMAETEYSRAEALYDNAIDHYTEDSPEYRDYRTAQKTTMRRWTVKIEEHKAAIQSIKTRKKLFDNFEQRVKRDPCVICYGEMTNVVLTKCSHIFCKECMQRVINENPHNIICPMCRTELNQRTDIGHLIEHKNVKDVESQYHQHVQKWGTKMAWLVQYLQHIMDSGTDRVIIFSQWKKMLRLVGEVLNEVKINCVYLQGSASQISRNIRRFKTSPDVRTIMLSSETCSSGSNLTEANHIILLDTVNGSASQAKAIEDQAIGRAARLGQTKNIQVARLIMNNTIEYDHYKQNIDQNGITEIKGGEDITI